MRPAVAELLAWDGAAVAGAGATLLGRAGLVQHVEGEVRSVAADLPAAWSGTAADAAMAHHVRRAAEVHALADVVRAGALALQDVGEQIAAARAQLQSALADAAAAGCAVGSDGSVVPPPVAAVPYGLSGPPLVSWQDQAQATAQEHASTAARLGGQIHAALDAAATADAAGQAALAVLSAPPVSPAPVVATGPASVQGLLAGALGLAADGLTWLQHALLSSPLPTDSASLFVLLQSARASGQAPARYADVLKAYWQAKALEHAGIDGSSWKPALGVDANRATVLEVYEYYRRLYQQDPSLECAGLANLVGPGFAAAFLDLGSARDVARSVQKAGHGSLAVPGAGLGELANLTDDQLHFYENTFLKMQQDIFLDIGAMHEAYLSGPDGMANIREMAEAALVRGPVLVAWQTIDAGRTTGSATLLHDGARRLADWEQNHVIADSWDAMRKHQPEGAALTYLMTVVGRPSVPGAHFPGQVNPLTVDVPVSKLDGALLMTVPPLVGPLLRPFLPHTVKMQTPLPDFDVSVRQDRWRYFTSDTMPAYTALLDEPGRTSLAAEMARPLGERIAEQRIWDRTDDIVGQFSPQHWKVHVR